MKKTIKTITEEIKKIINDNNVSVSVSTSNISIYYYIDLVEKRYNFSRDNSIDNIKENLIIRLDKISSFKKELNIDFRKNYQEVLNFVRESKEELISFNENIVNNSRNILEELKKIDEKIEQLKENLEKEKTKECLTFYQNIKDGNYNVNSYGDIIIPDNIKWVVNFDKHFIFTEISPKTLDENNIKYIQVFVGFEYKNPIKRIYVFEEIKILKKTEEDLQKFILNKLSDIKKTKIESYKMIERNQVKIDIKNIPSNDDMYYNSYWFSKTNDYSKKWKNKYFQSDDFLRDYSYNEEKERNKTARNIGLIVAPKYSISSDGYRFEEYGDAYYQI